MGRETRLRVVVVVLAASVVMSSCRDAEHASPVAASATTTASSVQSMLLSTIASARVMSNSRIGPAAVTFPPNNEPYDFRLRLEGYYQNTLRASTSQTYVNLEGGGVWISEYIRYRVFRCSHNVAVSSVMTQIDTLRGVIPPTCGEPPAGTVEFPPRNEPADFRNQLEVKYRDGLRASPTSSYVNLEGDIVWMQQYFLYRLNGCNHEDASNKTLVNITTGQVQSFCVVAPPPPPQARVTVFIDGPSGFVNANRAVSFSGLRSTSNAGSIVSYAWNCGAPNVAGCNSGSPTPSFIYPKAGKLGTFESYTVTLTVTDSAGNRGSATGFVNVTQVY